LAVVKEEVNADGCKESGIFFFFFLP
jgi:hypothetical protein